MYQKHSNNVPQTLLSNTPLVLKKPFFFLGGLVGWIVKSKELKKFSHHFFSLNSLPRFSSLYESQRSNLVSLNTNKYK